MTVVVRAAFTANFEYCNWPRFEAPVAGASWEDVADAVVAPAACPQPPPSPITPLELNRTSEDCLYLNIFAPEITVIKNLHFWNISS